jgi:hypothetical protein
MGEQASTEILATLGRALREAPGEGFIRHLTLLHASTTKRRELANLFKLPRCTSVKALKSAETDSPLTVLLAISALSQHRISLSVVDEPDLIFLKLEYEKIFRFLVKANACPSARQLDLNKLLIVSLGIMDPG